MSFEEDANDFPTPKMKLSKLVEPAIRMSERNLAHNFQMLDAESVSNVFGN